jgi:hypothetical protein
METAKGLNNMLMIKQLIWHTIKDPTYFERNYGNEIIYNSTLDMYIKLIYMETRWIDVLRLLEFLRFDIIPSAKKNILAAISDCFTRMLKVDGSQCSNVVNYIR